MARRLRERRGPRGKGPREIVRRVLILLAISSCFFTLPGAGGQTPPGEEAPFGHTFHVSSSWIFSEEKPRDCRGCHDYARQSDPSPATCRKCHYLDEHRTIRAVEGFETGLEKLRDRRSSFRHEFHLAFECKSCHNPAMEEFGQTTENLQDIVIPADMPIPRGSGVCLKCHDPDSESPDPRAKLPETLRRHLARLNASPSMGPEGFSGFRHLDHMSEEDFRNPASCRTCHESVVNSDIWSLATSEYSTESCGRCHVSDEQGTALEYISGEVPGPSVTGGCFSHQDHLKPEALEAEPELARDLCLACHAYDEKKATFAVKPRFGKYSGCVSCHAHQSWKVEDHGEVDDCRGCHTVGQGSMKENRPRVTVMRRRPTSFRITTQAHPFITGNQAPTGECARCHVAQVPELPSRLGEKKFSHHTHLPEKPTAEDCNTCHLRTVAGSSDPRAFETTFQIEACKDCHRGVEELEVTWPAPAELKPRSVVEFSHADHLGPDRLYQGKPLDCLTCHSGDATADGADLGVKPEALACTTCHDHDENSEITGGKDRAYVETCTRCHRSGVPRKGEVVELPRQQILSVKGSQFHPLEGECKTCHFLPLDQVTRLEREQPDHYLATLKTDEPFHFIQNDGYRARRANDDCLCCHWGQQVRRDRRPTALKGARVEKVRDLLGEVLQGFPGKDCAGP